MTTHAGLECPPPWPPQSRWPQVAGVRLHVLTEGEGSPVVLLHGNPMWSYLWRHAIPVLSRLLRTLGAPRVVLVGHDWGAVLAMHWAAPPLLTAAEPGRLGRRARRRRHRSLGSRRHPAGLSERERDAYNRPFVQPERSPALWSVMTAATNRRLRGCRGR